MVRNKAEQRREYYSALMNLFLTQEPSIRQTGDVKHVGQMKIILT